MSLLPSVKHGTRYRLSLLVMACVLPMLVLIALIVVEQYRNDRAQLIQKSILTARAMAQAVDKHMDSVEAGLHALASSSHLQSGDLMAFHRQAKEVLKNLNANNVYVADATGQILIHTHVPFGTPLPIARNSALVKQVFATGQSAVSDLFTGVVTKTPLVAVFVPVFKDEKVIYVLAATFHPERLSSILTNQKLPNEWIAAIYDGQGRFIARTRGIDALLGQKGSAAILEKIAGSPEGALESRTVDGTTVIGVFSRSKVADWAIAIGIPKAHLTAQLWEEVGLIAAVTSFILLGTLLLAWRLGGKIADSIHALIEPALALGRNEKVQVASLYLREADEVGRAIERAADILEHTRHKAYHDPLTGLANRALFHEIAEQQLALCRRYGEGLAILYMDLDGFKQVNDTHGHAVGDQLLRQVAARLQAEVRRSDLVARLGGDEFSAVLMNTDRAGAETVAAKLIDMLSAPYLIDAISLTHVSVSIGVATYPEASQDLETLLQSADYAMYVAKSAGKRRYAVADPDAQASLAEGEPRAATDAATHADKASY